MSVSIVQYFGEQTSKCGYCAGFNCSRSHGKNISKRVKKIVNEFNYVIFFGMHEFVIRQVCMHTVCPAKTTRS